MPRVFLMIRREPPYRAEAFAAGFRRLGYEVHSTPREGALRPSDVLVIWNRYGLGDSLATRFEQARARVLVAENGYLGRDWRGGHWYALARNYHNGAGSWPDGGPERWDAWRVELAPWREGGGELVALPTRHIGPPGVAEPRDWLAGQIARLRAAGRTVRVRPHPGERPAVPLEHDLRDASAVLTWGSGAALKALLMGVPVLYGFPRWIGAGAAQHVSRAYCEPDRLGMFRRLAWAMWSTEELATGEPMRWLLG